MSKHEHLQGLVNELNHFVDAFGLKNLAGQLMLSLIHSLLDGACALLSDPVYVNEQLVTPNTFSLSDFGVGNAFLARYVGTARRTHEFQPFFLANLTHVYRKWFVLVSFLLPAMTLDVADPACLRCPVCISG